jgi:hypothetical protein
MAKKQQQSQSTGNNCSSSGKSATAVTVTTITVAADTVDKNNCSGMETAAVTATACIHSNCGGKEAIAVAAARAQPQSQLLQSQWTKSNYSGETAAATTVDMQQLPIQTNQAVGCNRSS